MVSELVTCSKICFMCRMTCAASLSITNSMAAGTAFEGAIGCACMAGGTGSMNAVGFIEIAAGVAGRTLRKPRNHTVIFKLVPIAKAGIVGNMAVYTGSAMA